MTDYLGRSRRWLRWHLGAALSQLGEAVGNHALTYNWLHFHSFHEHAKSNAPAVVKAICTIFPLASRFIDVGAGSGAFAAELMRVGKTVVALEHSAAGRRLGIQMGVDIRPFDLDCGLPADLPEAFDVAYCFEVAEHLPAQLGNRLVELVASKAPVVIFSAAPPGQTGTGHINEQPKSYWIERFYHCGMREREDLSRHLSKLFEADGAASWFVANVIVFERLSLECDSV